MKAAVKEKIWTYEDYISGKIPPDVSEIINGKEVKKMPARDLHGRLVLYIGMLLEKNLKNYLVFVGEVGLVLSRRPLNLRAADIVVISKYRWVLSGKSIDVPPDLIVEVVSSYEDAGYILRKIREYSEWGIKRQIWIFAEGGEVVGVSGENIKVYTKDEEVELLKEVKFRLRDLLKKVGYEGNG